MPRHTETQIDELCAKAKAAKSERELQHVLKLLRTALSQHIGFARQSLEAQVSALTTLEAKAKYHLTKGERPKPRKRQEANSRSVQEPSDDSSPRPNAA